MGAHGHPFATTGIPFLNKRDMAANSRLVQTTSRLGLNHDLAGTLIARRPPPSRISPTAGRRRRRDNHPLPNDDRITFNINHSLRNRGVAGGIYGRGRRRSNRIRDRTHNREPG